MIVLAVQHLVHMCSITFYFWPTFQVLGHRINLTFCKGNSKIAPHVLLNFVRRVTEKFSDVLNASVFELL